MYVASETSNYLINFFVKSILIRKTSYLWLAAALQTNMIDFFQVFCAWMASCSSLLLTKTKTFNRSCILTQQHWSQHKVHWFRLPVSLTPGTFERRGYLVQTLYPLSPPCPKGTPSWRWWALPFPTDSVLLSQTLLRLHCLAPSRRHSRLSCPRWQNHYLLHPRFFRWLSQTLYPTTRI